VAGSLLTQNWERRSRHVNHPPEICLYLSAPVFFAELLDRSHIRVSSIIDHDIEPAKGLDGGGDSCASLFGTGDVKGKSTHLSPIFFYQITELLRFTSGSNQAVSMSQHGLG
jgi:hypothetical protein